MRFVAIMLLVLNELNDIVPNRSQTSEVNRYHRGRLCDISKYRIVVQIINLLLCRDETCDYPPIANVLKVALKS